jgi:hypothetical protein
MNQNSNVLVGVIMLVALVISMAVLGLMFGPSAVAFFFG